MKQFQHTLTVDAGLHGRPATLLVKAAREVSSEVSLEFAGRTAPAGQILSLMTLGARKGDTVTVRVTGGDEDASLAAMEKFFKDNL